eukprot:4350515-Amphidinium_carterae.1
MRRVMHVGEEGKTHLGRRGERLVPRLCWIAKQQLKWFKELKDADVIFLADLTGTVCGKVPLAAAV